jgi:acyl-CoA dehydrogenase
MNELRDLVRQIMTDAAADPDRAYRDLAGAGLTRIGVPEALGGVGGTRADATTVLREVARHPIAVPIAEAALLCGPTATAAGMAYPGDDTSVAFDPARPDAFTAHQAAAGWTVSGTATGVPWAAAAGALLVVAASDADDLVVGLLPTAEAVVHRADNLAGEPRDRVTIPPGTPLRDAHRTPLETFENLRLNAALARAAQLSGALEAVLAMTVAYTGERHQFGRPLARFQAVRQQLALMAADVTAATTAVSAAAHRLRPIDIMTAKIETSRAATVAARIAHHLHGAMGTTYEYPLHRYTTRLWSWRDEYGNEDHWAARLATCLDGGDDLWQALTDRPPGQSHAREDLPQQA